MEEELVISDPAGLSCEKGACAGAFAPGEQVLLQAYPTRELLFMGWGADVAVAGDVLPMKIQGRHLSFHARFDSVQVCSTAGWCWNNPLPQGDPINALWGTSSRDLWAVGGTIVAGTVLHRDGGPWQSVSLPSFPRPGPLYGIWGQGKEVWVVGHRATVLHWDGNAWRRPAEVPLKELVWNPGCNRFDREDRLQGIWGDGRGGLVAAGTRFEFDGDCLQKARSTAFALTLDGDGWRRQEFAANSELYGVWGSGPADAWAVGKGGLLLHRGPDRGWIQAKVPRQVDLYAIWGTGPQDVWTVGAAGTSLRFQGKEWTEEPTSTTVPLRALWGSGQGDVWAAGAAGTILHWIGRRWFPEGSEQSDLLALWGQGDDVLAAGDGGAMVWRQGFVWRRLGAREGASPATLARVWGTPDGPVWAVGDKGTILLWDPAAGLFRRHPDSYGMTDDIHGLWGSGPNDIWAVDGVRHLWHWDGQRWGRYPVDAPSEVSALWGSGPKDIYAVGVGIVHSDGTNWGSNCANCAEPLDGLWGAGSNDVWAVGQRGTILHGPPTTDGDWEKIGLPTALFQELDKKKGFSAHWLTAVWGSGGKDIWIAGDKGILIHAGASVPGCGDPVPDINRTDFTWQDCSRPDEPLFNSLWGTGPADVWLAGAGGEIYHYDGQSWKLVDSGSATGISAIWGDRRGLWAVGDRGATLLRRPQ